jgi:hypothetical protein
MRYGEILHKRLSQASVMLATTDLTDSQSAVAAIHRQSGWSGDDC